MHSSFPFADAAPTVADVPIADFAAHGVAVLQSLLPGETLRATIDAVSTPMPAAASAWVRSDGAMLGLFIPAALAAGLASVRLGGDFAADAGFVQAASVRRAREQLRAALCTAVDGLWPAAACDWQPANAPTEGTRQDLVIVVGDVSVVVALTLAAAPAVQTQPQRSDQAWTRGMRALLSATGLPLRAILHERQIPLAEAIRLRPGDVLPIDTPREVQLRIGTHRLARGSVAPVDGTLVVTIAQRRAGAGEVRP